MMDPIRTSHDPHHLISSLPKRHLSGALGAVSIAPPSAVYRPLTAYTRQISIVAVSTQENDVPLR